MFKLKGVSQTIPNGFTGIATDGGLKRHYKDGVLHRTDGWAVESRGGYYGEYWLDGVFYSNIDDYKTAMDAARRVT